MITEEQLKKLEDFYQLCEFTIEEGECKHPTGTRVWFERTDPEVVEGDYYCDSCGIERIERQEATDKLYRGYDPKLLA